MDKCAELGEPFPLRPSDGSLPTLRGQLPAPPRQAPAIGPIYEPEPSDSDEEDADNEPLSDCRSRTR